MRAEMSRLPTRRVGAQVKRMKFSHISRLFLATVMPMLAGCSWISGSADGVRYTANSPLGGESEISGLRSQLVSENLRAIRAERAAQRARAEADWLAKTALEEPELRVRNGEMEKEIIRLSAENQRIVVLEANLRDLALENDKLERALRGDWSEIPVTRAPAPARLIEQMPVAAETGSSEQSPTTVAPGDGDYGDGAYAVHLASYRSKAQAVGGWQRLRQRFPGLLGNLSGHFAIFDIASLGGRYYRLKAGPFEGAVGAERLCRRLSSAGQYCMVSEFDGELLRQ